MLSANVQLYEIHICRFIHALGVTLFLLVRAWNGQAKSAGGAFAFAVVTPRIPEINVRVCFAVPIRSVLDSPATPAA